MKLILTLLLLFVGVLGSTQAQLNAGLAFGPKGGFAGFTPGQFFRTIVLQSEAEKLLVNPNLTDDLRQRILDSLASAEQGFNNCSTVAVLPWTQIRCSALQLQRSKNELKAIENEIAAGSSAVSNAPSAEAGAAATSAN